MTCGKIKIDAEYVNDACPIKHRACFSGKKKQAKYIYDAFFVCFFFIVILLPVTRTNLYYGIFMRLEIRARPAFIYKILIE